MSYYLSEAYSDLYNPRTDSFLNDNLRFLDYMQDYEIEEVVESLFWELRDYGNTLDESFEILQVASSDEVITEAYEEILEEFLTESRSQVMARRAAAGQALQQQKARLQSDVRKDARRARVDGAISRVKAGIAGARGGMGRAAKSIGSAATGAAKTVSSAAQEGKARLSQLLRRGVSKVQAGAGRVSRAYSAAKKELTGETGRQSEVRNAMRQNIRNVRAAQRAQAGQDTSAFEKPSTPRGPVRSTIGNVPPGPAARSGQTLQRASKPPLPPAPAKRYPVEPSGQTSLFSGPVKGKPAGPSVKVPSGGQRKYGAAPKRKGGERTRQLPMRFPKA